MTYPFVSFLAQVHEAHRKQGEAEQYWSLQIAHPDCVNHHSSLAAETSHFQAIPSLWKIRLQS